MVAAGCAARLTPVADSASIAFTHVTLIDASGARRIDGTGKYLIPGLWDMHAHTLWDPVVRDMGGTLEVLAAVRADVRRGALSSPRLVAAGPMLDGPRPVDPSISIAVAAAARHDLPVAGHVPAEVTDAEAAARMRSIEHMRSETGGFCTRIIATVCDSLFPVFRRHGTWQTPTLAVRRARAFIYDSALAADPRLRYVPPVLRDIWIGNRARRLRERPASYFSEIKVQHDDERWLAAALHRAGLPLLARAEAAAR